jgi:ribosome-associated toxin RatA of RatAB toxin-antitoxin module
MSMNRSASRAGALPGGGAGLFSRAAACLLLACAPAAAAPTVTLSREGGAFRLEAAFETQAAAEIVWEVLTDYDGMTRYLRSLRKSRVVRRTPKGAVIEQEGVARLAVFSKRVALTLDVAEKPPGLIEFRETGGGQFEEYEGAWTITQSSASCSVSYRLFAEMKPSLVPRAAARRVLASSVRRQLEEVSAEIERRARAAGQGR